VGSGGAYGFSKTSLTLTSELGDWDCGEGNPSSGLTDANERSSVSRDTLPMTGVCENDIEISRLAELLTTVAFRA
jgi:hypothetical protein